MEPTAAKQFLISSVIEEAGVEQVSLSEVEKKMLYFTEVHPSLPDIYEVNAEFERDYDNDEYEAKIAGLLKNARDRDRRSSASREQDWKDALDALKHEDHYILVMVSQAFGFGSASAGGHRVRDFLIYIVVGIALVLFIVLKTLWTTHR
jgi:ribosomal protein L11 methylase PrmA